MLFRSDEAAGEGNAAPGNAVQGDAPGVEVQVIETVIDAVPVEPDERKE